MCKTAVFIVKKEKTKDRKQQYGFSLMGGLLCACFLIYAVVIFFTPVPEAEMRKLIFGLCLSATGVGVCFLKSCLVNQ